MQRATVHLLVALYALCHRRALTPADLANVERSGKCLTPELWRQTRALLREADRGASGTRLELGFTPFILRWLSLPDEEAFVRAFGVGIAESLERDRSRLAMLADAIGGGAGPEVESVRALVADGWSRRASKLMEGLPELAEPAIEALDQALEAWPYPDSFRREFLESLRTAGESCGDRDVVARADRLREADDEEIEQRGLEDAAPEIAATALTVLWCVAHGEGLLGSEREPDPEVEPSPGDWAKVRAAVRDGRLDDIPLPVGTFGRWSGRHGLDEDFLHLCLGFVRDELTEMAVAVDVLWGEAEPPESWPSDMARYVQRVASDRCYRLQGEYRPLPGERQNLSFEVFQGARRPEALERHGLVARVHRVLQRSADIDPLAMAMVHVDQASDWGARGEFEKLREHLDEAAEWSRRLDDGHPAQGAGEMHVAEFLWQSGEVAEARAILRRTERPLADGILERIASKEREREDLRRAERACRRREDLESRCELALAHLAAGHNVRAERMARELAASEPDEPRVWLTLATLFFRDGRYRDAVGPARTAAEKGGDESAALVLLAQALSRLGPEGRDESRALAVRLVEAHPDRTVLPSADLAELATIAHGAGADISHCRVADDHVRALGLGEDPAEEWLGAAVARRVDVIWADDAVAWLARLAEVADDQPIEVARFVVERIEALLRLRLLAGRRIFGRVEGLFEECLVFARTRSLLEDRYGIEAGLEATDHETVADLLAECAGPVAGEAGALGRTWGRHRPAIESAFGEALAARLYASELAQRVLIGLDGAGERETALALAMLEWEFVGWMRWVCASEPVRQIGEGLGGGGATGTTARLKPIVSFSDREGDDRVGGATWANRWHEAERR